MSGSGLALAGCSYEWNVASSRHTASNRYDQHGEADRRRTNTDCGDSEPDSPLSEAV
jgi:hypothetical protein